MKDRKEERKMLPANRPRSVNRMLILILKQQALKL